MKSLIDQLEQEQALSRENWIRLLTNHANLDLSEYLFARARRVQNRYFGHDIYIRGLIEFTNYCKNNCYYCGIRRDHSNMHRYRLDKETILSCCSTGYALGFRTFVLQGGEDPYFTDECLTDLIRTLKGDYPDCAITLSIGERDRKSYQLLFDAGADRYLLRHETFDSEHYASLHPAELSAANRQQCLLDLKAIGFQTGSGFMVGSPGQSLENIADDLLFLKRLNPHMVGIGPFIPHQDTPFRDYPAGPVPLTLFLLGLVRLMLPTVLLPATTALGTMDPNGREKGILAGANVVMPNLSPLSVRKDYALYDNKICTGEEAAEGLLNLKKRIQKIGYQIVIARGDAPETSSLEPK